MFFLNKIIYFVLILLFLLCFNDKVYASSLTSLDDSEEVSKDIGKNDKGHVTSGYYRVMNLGTYYDLDIEDRKGSGLYIVRNKEKSVYALYTVDFSDENGNFIDFGEAWGSGNFELTYDDGSKEVVEWAERRLMAGYNLYRPDDSDMGFSTNIPIFVEGDEAAINNYIQNGDYSGADNAEIIDGDSVEFDESVELPVGLKVTGGYAQGLENAYSMDKDCIFNWTQTVDTSNYMYDVDCEMTINLVSKNIGSSSQTDKYYSSGWIDFYEKKYDGSKAITSKVSKNDLNDILIGKCLENYNVQTGEKMPYKGYVVSALRIRVRNVCNGKSSNFVVIKIDKDGNSTTATVQDENGDTVEDENYDGSDVVDKENVVDMDLSNFVDILNFIRNGFGLFGNNGLIAMFRSFFSFLPDMWWTLILLGLGMIIFIGIVNFLLKR